MCFIFYVVFDCSRCVNYSPLGGKLLCGHFDIYIYIYIQGVP